MASLLLTLIKHVTSGFSQRGGTILLIILACSFKTLKFDLIIHMNKLLPKVVLENVCFQAVAKIRQTLLQSIENP